MIAAAISASRRARSSVRRALGLGLAVLGLVALGTGCAGRATEICDLQCECEHCSDAEYERCRINVNEGLDVADAYDCTDEADRLYQCAIDSGHCHNVGGSDHFVYDDHCAFDLEDLALCEDRNSALH
jgi:hypothetical protein